MDASYCDVFVIEVEREKYRIKPWYEVLLV
jgi:hypothetical protein